VAETFEIQVQDINEPPTDIALDVDQVLENLAGLPLGRFSVSDPDAGDSHTVEVLDDRFELVDGLLKLKDQVGLSLADGANVSIQVRAGDAGTPQQFLVGEVMVQLLANPFPWHHAAARFDVNRDTVVTPEDALNLVNYLNEQLGNSALPLPKPLSEPSYDVARDGLATPRDVLLVINHINLHGDGGVVAVAEGEAPPRAGTLAEVEPVFARQSLTAPSTFATPVTMRDAARGRFAPAGDLPATTIELRRAWFDRLAQSHEHGSAADTALSSLNRVPPPPFDLADRDAMGTPPWYGLELDSLLEELASDVAERWAESQ
jgi:hypothetical protein